MVLGASPMRNRFLAVAVAAVFGGFAIPHAASAALIGVNQTAGNSSLGVAAAIIAAPPNVIDDAPGRENRAQEGFDEAQGVVTGAAFTHDFGVIAAGTLVDSHMIFLNTSPNDPGTTSHYGVDWTFDGMIIGVMSNRDGSYEVASSGELGAPGTTYPGAPFGARGLEAMSMGLGGSDGYAIVDPFTIRVDMRVSEPGDWIRVVTKPIPEPSTAMLLGLGLAGLAGRRRLGA